MEADKTLQEVYDKEELSEEDWDRFREAVRAKYRFFIINPASMKGVNYGLYYVTDEFEYPIASSNTGGFTTWSSRSKDIGDGLTELTDEFFSLVGYGFHEIMCFTPVTFDVNNRLEYLADEFYDGKVRDYEFWLAHELIYRITFADKFMPELEPICQWADRHTKFGVPMLRHMEVEEE